MRIAVLFLVSSLAACGGGLQLDFGSHDDEDPFASGRAATATVSAATETVLDGTYSSTDVELTDVERFNSTDPANDFCRFRFGGLRQSGSSRELAGTISYSPTSSTRSTNELRTTTVTVGGDDYTLTGPSGGSVDTAGDRVLFAGAVLSTTSGATQRITLTADIPMRTDRPRGC
jgi:hypothetical protein